MHISRWWVMWCTMWIITDFNFSVFAHTKNMKFSHGGHFEFQQNLKQITCTSPYCGECDSRNCIISDFKFWSFCAYKQIWNWPLAAIFNFDSVFKKSLAHPHVAMNVMLKFEKNDQTNFYAPQIIKVDLWRPFWISVKPWKNHLHIFISWGV